MALIRAFCAAAGPPTRRQSRPVHNFFRSAKADALDSFADLTKQAKRAHKRAENAASEKSDVTKALIPSALLHDEYFLAPRSPPAKIFHRDAASARTMRGVRGEDGRRLHTKLSEVTVIFFLL